MPPSAIARSVSSAIVRALPVAGQRRRPASAGTAVRTGAGTSARRRSPPCACVERLRRTPPPPSSIASRPATGARSGAASPPPLVAAEAVAGCRSADDTISARSFAPGARQLVEDVGKSGPAPSRRRRKVRAAKERLEVGREPHAHRPAAGAGRRLHEESCRRDPRPAAPRDRP